MREFFDIKTPEAQLKQLEQDYAQLQQDPGDVGTARSFFVTAAHLPEWIKDRAYKKSLQQQELIVEICDELANGGKHGKSDKKKPVVLHTEYDAYVERDYVEPGYYEETLQVTLTLEAAQELGMENQVTDVLTLATLTLEFWKAHPAFKSR